MDGSANVGRTWTAGVGARHRVSIIVFVCIASVLTLAGAALAIDVDRFSDAHGERLLPGTTIAGVDVGRMTRDQAIEAVEAAVTTQLEATTIEVEAAGEVWRRTRRELGATADVAAQVDHALTLAQELSWWQWVGVRYRSHDPGPDLEVTIDDPASGSRRLAQEIAEAIDLAPLDAQLEIIDGAPLILPDADGRQVDVGKTAALIAGRVASGGTVGASVTVLPAAVPASHYDQILLLDQSEHRLDVFLRGELVRSFTVATGTGEYPTPQGIFEVTLKRYMPTWVNPSPGGWGRNMPASIPPGPNNPLGVRALNWSAPGAIRFHGTANVDSLGTDASHGCVRLSNGDVVELYDLVDVGAVIVSLP